MKFLIMFVSLLMFCFGGIFMSVTNNTDEIIKRVKEKVGHTEIPEDVILQGNKLILKIRNISFVVFISGICLFITSLFL